MTSAQRLYNYMALLPVVHIDRRPRLVTRSEGDPVEKICPFATFEDLQESIYLMEYSNGVRPYVLEWYNDIFLKEYNEKINEAATNGGDPREAIAGLTTCELADAIFKIKQLKVSSKHILENFVDPLVNAGYLDKVVNQKDKRSYLLYPVVNAKQKKLFDSVTSNNLSQQRAIILVDSTMFPDRNYLIPRIQGFVNYSSEIHKITRLENHEFKEITVEELVDQYYKDPDKYFEADKDKSSTSTDGGRATAIAISRASEIENTKKETISDEHSLEPENGVDSQQVAEVDIKFIQNQDKESTELFERSKSNNFLTFKCYYCKYQINVETDYERHVVLRHPGKLAYPTEMDLEKLGIKDISIDRKEQGKILAQTNSFVRRISEKSYVVISQSGNGTYEVNATECGWSCSCPDSTYRGVKCKHIHAVELATDVKKEYISS